MNSRQRHSLFIHLVSLSFFPSIFKSFVYLLLNDMIKLQMWATLISSHLSLNQTVGQHNHFLSHLFLIGCLMSFKANIEEKKRFLWTVTARSEMNNSKAKGDWALWMEWYSVCLFFSLFVWCGKVSWKHNRILICIEIMT